jgi:hypothetical protein
MDGRSIRATDTEGPRQCPEEESEEIRDHAVITAKGSQASEEKNVRSRGREFLEPTDNTFGVESMQASIRALALIAMQFADV